MSVNLFLSPYEIQYYVKFFCFANELTVQTKPTENENRFSPLLCPKLCFSARNTES